MLKLKLWLAIPLATLFIGLVAGFLVALGHHATDWAYFVGSWIGSGLAVAMFAVIPVALVCLIWNAVISTISK